MQQRIGIVLNNVPAYSETFLLNKINGLIERGARVTIFAEKSGHAFPMHWNVISPFKLPSNGLLRNLFVAAGMMRMALSCSKKSYKFFKLERIAGRSSKTALENLYINGHIIARELDWLHYGFATVAVRRENVAKAIGARMAVSLRGYDIAVYPLKNKDCYNLLWSNVDKIHSISDDLVRRAYDLGLPINKRIVKIMPAIDIDKFSVQSRGSKNTELNILTIARLSWIKGLQYALQAMKLLKDKKIPFKYTIVGDGPEMECLLFAAHQFGIKEHVVFAGKVKANDVPAYMASHTVYLQPSLQEGFCNAALEAQAAGLLTIVTDGGALKENVIDNETGWIINRRDPLAIATAIQKVAAMAESERQRIINNAYQRVRREFAIEKQLSAFEAFYD